MQQAISRNALCPCGTGRKYKLCCGAQAKSIAAAGSGPRLIVLQPTRGSISIETHQALTSHMDGIQTIVAHVARKPVDIARNELARIAGDIVAQHPEADTVLWIDDDAWWAPGTITAMLRKLSTLGENDILSAWCCTREAYAPAVAFEQEPTNAAMMRTHAKLVEAQFGDLVDVDALGAHFLMHRSSLLAKLGPSPFSVIELGGEVKTSEDIAFCLRVKAIGGRCYISVASETSALHVDVRTGLAYTPYGPPLRILGGSTVIHATPEDLEGMVGVPGMEVLEKSDSAMIVADKPSPRSYGVTVDDAIRRSGDGRESPVIIFPGIPIGNEPGRSIRHDLNGMTRDEAYGSLMNLLDTRAIQGFTLMPKADKMKHMAAIADMVGTSRNGGPKQVVMSAQARP
jgi:hypothetical protein